MEYREQLKQAKRIVVKIGSSSLTYETTGHISIRKMEHLVRQISDLKNAGREIILVSSGAQAVGRGAMQMKERPSDLPTKQAIAAVGQASLMMLYQKLFREYNHQVGQVLLTKDVLDDKVRHVNAKNTFDRLLEMDVIPIVNENDTVVTDEIEFGDNDRLSAMVAVLTKADLLLLMSDIDGLYTKDPRYHSDGKIVSEVSAINQRIYDMAGVSKSEVGTGGMITKLMAADMVTDASIDMVIANASMPYSIEKVISGDTIGTLFQAKAKQPQ